ncbi:hypothetical protein M5K25_001176 [Dendrobium thyrsiflorum]|uniref:PA domain-containing protein n=1 Tax=Dendrobium thyrsiflorum TaxID=117978 RepID=A0ABD0VPF1_DENTH
MSSMEWMELFLPCTRWIRTYNWREFLQADLMAGVTVGIMFVPQRPELLNKNLVEGKILLCGYSFNFVSGTTSIRKVCETAKILGAAGFVVAMESSYPGTKYDPVPVALPGILITYVSQTKELIDYYNSSTKRDWAGRPTGFQATASTADGLAPILHNSAPQVALFSSRGPDVKDFSFEDADVLKPDILAPGSLIWAAWAPNGTYEANYEGRKLINQRLSVLIVEN